MRARRKAKDQKAGSGVPESSHRLGPIFPAEIGTAFFPPDLLAIGDQSRAARAGDDLLIELDQAGRGRARLACAWLKDQVGVDGAGSHLAESSSVRRSGTLSGHAAPMWPAHPEMPPGRRAG